ncbi:tudor domain-containing protein 1 isoform X1 [Pygocentrus nattereri]|uniref:Tudor domain-containing protein 1 n=1 Tax=Pygocentrus nattereri TaxID=42514 RepID=A0A3B4DEM9_PYGNA|nr:tudor domain-containing protein 1 isoform X1 [Pygocentrus nattereri]XP_017551497.1 tudor domain-containing protein 1 isoform X1 [Pygocentrus nattereri]
MNRAFSPSLVRPNLPLRRPATGPGLVMTRNQRPVFNDLGAGSPQEWSPTNDSLDVLGAEGDRKENGLVTVKENSARDALLATSVMVKLCNYCGQQGNLRCTRCKKTCYCSVACQSEDWKAHRHLCKPSTPESSLSNKPKECLTMPCGSGPSVLESKVNSNVVVQPKRIFLSDLRRNSVSKGDEMQGTVVELRNPGKFFIHIQSVAMTETLRSISLELQKTYGSSHKLGYKPEVGELCAVKFSQDQNWYRGEVESVDLDRHTAKVLYIDFGNVEDVTFDQICALAENIDLAPPCALQCCVAGVMAVTGSWTGECCVAVRQLVAAKNLTFTVIDIMHSGSLFAVDAPLSTLGKNLSTFLIDQGYAIKESTPSKPQTEQEIYSLMTASFENFKRLSVGKNENIEAQPPEPLTQGVGDTFTAIVTHLQSPSEIICQKLENASAIQQLQISLREHCTKTAASENFRPAPGTVCCSLFSEDNQWYRAKVLAYSSEDRVCVGYVDFGNSEEVPLNHLRPISMELLALATQAIPCALAGIKPTSDVWSEDVILMLKRLVCNRFIQVEILGQRDGMALVSMIDESSDPQTNVAEMLVATGCATLGNMETATEAAKDVVSESPAVDKLEWSCAELPIDGQEVVLVVSVLENPGEFYCYNYKAEDMQTLAELSSELKTHCDTEKGPFSPVVGEPCCALFSGDGSWYRAMVQSVEGDGKARVYFVDYGNSCEVQVAHLRPIDSSLLKHPFQAIRCCLAGVEPMGGHWKEAAVQRFQALCVGKQLSGRVLSITERGYGVELRCNGQSFAAVLISEQLAKPSGQENKPAAQQNRSSDLKEASHAQMPMPTEKTSLSEQPANITVKGAASFPLDWKTVELPCRETFKPQVAAVISPSLFYVMNPREVNIKVLQAVMMDVAKYCSKQALPNQRVPLPGAACCAQFSGDKNWCRAVVLDTTSTHANVIYADYGNCERIPISSILPIPKDLLQHPFQIARCALSGKENLPTVWPPEVLELFGVQLSGKVLASVQGFDGTYNLLMLTQHSGLGGNINSVILGALHKVPGKASAEELAQETGAQDQGLPQAGSTSKTTEHTSSDTEKPKPGSQEKQKMKTVMTSVENKELQAAAGSKGISNAPVSSCCCNALKPKIDRIEELILLLIKHTEGNLK